MKLIQLLFKSKTYKSVLILPDMKKIKRINFVDTDNSFFLELTRQSSNSGRTLFEQIKLAKTDGYMSHFIHYTPIKGTEEDDEIGSFYDGVLQNAVKNKPSCIVLEPAGFVNGDRDDLFPYFLDLLIEERKTRGVVVLTLAGKYDNLFSQSKESGLITLNRDDIGLGVMADAVKKESLRYKG